MKYGDLIRIAENGGVRSGERYLNGKDTERARLVLVVGLKQVDVAKAEGVTKETISKAVRRARRGAQRLGIGQSN